MRDPELLETTASESLSLEEEYEMQKSWRHDENSKCAGWPVPARVLFAWTVREVTRRLFFPIIPMYPIGVESTLNVHIH